MSILCKRWLPCCLLFFLTACHSDSGFNQLVVRKQDSVIESARVKTAFIQIGSLKNIIHTGDLITRTGNDFTSQSLRTLNRHDKTYSHCGIASIEGDSIFIYHALGGEFNPDQKIRRDALEFFAEPFDNRGIGIFRYPLNHTEINNLMLVVKKMFSSGLMFDMEFDLATDDRMYCTEYASKCYTSGTANRLQFSTSKIKDFVFIGVDDLFTHPLCAEVKRVIYK